MGEELRVPHATLAGIRDRLHDGRAALEETGGSAPRSVDAGELTGVVAGLLATVVDHAAALSEVLGGVQAAVAEAGDHFRETDAGVAADYGWAEASGVD